MFLKLHGLGFQRKADSAIKCAATCVFVILNVATNCGLIPSFVVQQSAKRIEERRICFALREHAFHIAWHARWRSVVKATHRSDGSGKQYGTKSVVVQRNISTYLFSLRLTNTY